MVINALNSAAYTYMADFEGQFLSVIMGIIHAIFNILYGPSDSNAPTWENNISGQVNLRDAVRGNITFTAPNGKYYKLKEGRRATLIVR